ADGGSPPSRSESEACLTLALLMLLLKVFFAIAFTCCFSDFVSAPAAIAVPPSTAIRPTHDSTRPRRFNLLILLSMLLTLPLSHRCSAEEALPWSNVFGRSVGGQGELLKRLLSMQSSSPASAPLAPDVLQSGRGRCATNAPVAPSARRDPAGSSGAFSAYL